MMLARGCSDPVFPAPDSIFARFDYLLCVDSTNEYLKRFAAEGRPRIVAAREQTAGKGRYGRHWFSPAGEGLYVSYLIYPRWPAGLAPLLTVVAGLAVVGMLEEKNRGLPIGVKTPNDILIRGRKVAGILTEMSTQEEKIIWAVIGIGVNLSARRFPPELEGRATSLAREGLEVEDPVRLCARLTRHLEWACRQAETDGRPALVRAWEALGGKTPLPGEEEA